MNSIYTSIHKIVVDRIEVSSADAIRRRLFHQSAECCRRGTIVTHKNEKRTQNAPMC